MNRKLCALLIVMMFVFSVATVSAKKNKEAVYITDGVLVYGSSHYLAGEVIPVGFDEYGYNYNSHLFQGYYANVYLGGDGYPAYTGSDDDYPLDEYPGVVNTLYWPYRNVEIVMKWNDAWLANSDADGDGKLDRHYGYTSYIGSGAWESYHEYGIDENGKNYSYFSKIVAAPADAYIDSDVWYSADGTEIGPVIWNEFAIILETMTGYGAYYKSPLCVGLGFY